MSDVATAPTAVSTATLEAVLATGDLSKLTPGQRIEYVSRVCQTIGLNPFTRPIRFLRLGSEIVPYFTRDGSDQLRRIHKVSLSVTDQRLDGDVYVVTVKASTPDGRSDEDIGAVTIGRLQSESKANALMKCITKAKRRVTLSICGLGFMDESELDTLGSIQTFDAGEPTPPPGRKAVSDQQATEVYGAKPDQWERWKTSLQHALDAAQTWDDVRKIADRASVQTALGTEAGAAPFRIQRDIRAQIKAAYEKLAPADEPLPAGVSEEETWDLLAALKEKAKRLDLIGLAELNSSAEWRSRVHQLLPTEQEELNDYLEQRRIELRNP